MVNVCAECGNFRGLKFRNDCCGVNRVVVIARRAGRLFESVVWGVSLTAENAVNPFKGEGRKPGSMHEMVVAE